MTVKSDQFQVGMSGTIGNNWVVVPDGAGGLLFKNGTVDGGSTTKMTLSSAGVMTFAGNSLIPEAAAPGTPGASLLALYGKTDHELYLKDSSGNERKVGTRGVTDGSNAAAGQIGEYMEQIVNGISFPAAGTYGDAASLALTAGDWDLTLMMQPQRNGSSWTDVELGITPTSGNSGAGLTPGSNRVDATLSTSFTLWQFVIASYRVSLSATTTYYAKMEWGGTGGPPTIYGRFSARRVR